MKIRRGIRWRKAVLKAVVEERRSGEKLRKPCSKRKLRWESMIEIAKCDGAAKSQKLKIRQGIRWGIRRGKAVLKEGRSKGKLYSRKL